jgi:hypothetical protein
LIAPGSVRSITVRTVPHTLAQIICATVFRSAKVASLALPSSRVTAEVTRWNTSVSRSPV